MNSKVYTIGRDTSCDIVIADSSDVVSRVHASLKVKGGKYILVDQSRNGTYVNGIRMSANEEVPVSRKDSISFAHVADLDWNMIPKEKDHAMIWILAVLAALVVFGSVWYFGFRQDESETVAKEENDAPVETVQEPKVKNDTIRDTIIIKEQPRKDEKRGRKAKKEDPDTEKTSKEDVIDPIF